MPHPLAGDDHERATCPKAGAFGHYMCGTCPTHGGPRFRCGCCGCASHAVRRVDGLGREVPSYVRLALVFEHASVSCGPRDEETRRWLTELGGMTYCIAAIDELRARWLYRGVTRGDLPAMAAEMQRLIRERYASHADGHPWHHPPIEIEVRACEYVAPPPTHLDLVEIR